MSSSIERIIQFRAAVDQAVEEILDQGRKYGHGFSIMEIKFADGVPTVIVRSHSQSRKYPSDSEAHGDIIEIIGNLESGSQTFTVLKDNGVVKRVLVDQYSTNVLS